MASGWAIPTMVFGPIFMRNMSPFFSQASVRNSSMPTRAIRGTMPTSG
jgi:hypothetical protein